jgi:hypothetical protein
MRLSAAKKDVLLQLAISEMAKGVKDYKTASGIETTALKGVEAAMQKITQLNALAPSEMTPISMNPRK